METSKKIFRNRFYVGRNYEATNIVYCIADLNPDADRWVEVDAMPGTMDFIYSERGATFYGFM